MFFFKEYICVSSYKITAIINGLKGVLIFLHKILPINSNYI